MATVRKSRDPARKNKPWIADYADQHGKRHQQHFRTEKEAKAFLIQAGGEVAKGIHTPKSGSITVAEACELWLYRCEKKGLARGSMRMYRGHVSKHIVPLIGSVKLAELTLPMVESYCDELLKLTTRGWARRVVFALRCILYEAQRRGLVAQNVAR